MNLCSTMRERSYWTWNQLQLARQLRLKIGEESITDFHILEITARHADEVKARIFTKREEGRFGADWEWWFVDKDQRCLGLAVQAKILNLTNNRFDVLHYKSGRQTTKLIKWAKRAAFPLCPVYCLYSHIPDLETALSAADRMLQTSEGKLIFRDLAPSYGCTLLPASMVVSLASVTDVARVIRDAVPWHWALCQETFHGASLTQRIERNLVNRYQGITVPVFSQPPTYITAMLAGEPVDQPRQGLGAVVIMHE